MCGFVGVVHIPGGPAAGRVVDEAVLRPMMAAIVHRGPDSSGTWTEGTAGLGHVRLSILDLSDNSSQPFLTDDEQGVLVYNGEVYNFRELRRELESEGVRFRSSGDTEVVLQAVHHWGPQAAVPKFNGMFALAYLNRRSGELWLARDRMGIKPLYWCETQGAFLFASEIKALLKHPLAPCRPDMHVLTSQLLTEGTDGDWTPFEGIRSVRAGTLMRLAGSQRGEIVYYDLLDAIDSARLTAGTGDRGNDWVDRFGEIFKRSVERHMVSDAPLAAMCSGGVDSSLIAACACESRPDLIGYVADVGGTASEAANARRVADHVGIRLREIDVDQAAYLRLWPRTVWVNDQPNYFGQDPVFLAVSERCSADGFKVLLTGEGSDELFGGYPWQAETWAMYRARKWMERLLPPIGPLRKLRRGLGRISAASPVARSRMPFQSDRDLLRVVGHTTHRAASPYQYALATFAEQRYLRHERIFNRLEFVRPVEERAFLAQSIDDTYSYLQYSLHHSDRMGMAASLESRFPFLDNALIDFALHLPFRAKRHRAHGKWTVRKYAADKLPAQTAFARKIGFACPPSVWMAGRPLLRDGFLAEALKWSAASRDTIVDRIAESKRLWYLLMSAELWGRMYFRGESLDALSEELIRSPLPERRVNGRNGH